MKKLHKTGIAVISALAPAAAAGVTAGVVLSSINFGDGIEMINLKGYKPTIAQYTPTTEEAQSGVSYSKGLEIYFEDLAKNPEIIKQDLFVEWSIQEREGVTFLWGMRINKVDKENQTIDFELKQQVTGVEKNGENTTTHNENYYVKVTNAKIKCDHIAHTNNWYFQIGSNVLSEIGDEVITGSLSGYTIDETPVGKAEIDYTGKEFTISKDSTVPTDPQEEAEFYGLFYFANRDFESYHFDNLPHSQE